MEPERARRTQAERRESTRRALLDATIASLIAVGYARTTTTEVVRRAGFSQGALFKHFPTKSDLVAAAVEQLFADLFVRFGEAFRADPRDAGEPPIVIAIRKLWEVFCTDELRVVYALYAEAPNEPALMAALRPVVADHEANLRRFAFELFPEFSHSEIHRSLFTSALFAMQGLSLQRPVHVAEGEEQRLLAGFEALGRQLFAATSGSGAEVVS